MLIRILQFKTRVIVIIHFISIIFSVKCLIQFNFYSSCFDWLLVQLFFYFYARKTKGHCKRHCIENERPIKIKFMFKIMYFFPRQHFGSAFSICQGVQQTIKVIFTLFCIFIKNFCIHPITWIEFRITCRLFWVTFINKA